MSRRFQFSLRAMLVAVVVAGVLLSWAANTAHFVEERKAVLRDFSGRLSVVHQLGDDAQVQELPWLRRAFGDEPIHALYDAVAEPDREYVQRLRRLFPEAQILLERDMKTMRLDPEWMARHAILSASTNGMPSGRRLNGTGPN
ncbi:MAG TPA: hypothetical protein VG826_23120 [Pirellulales bacterium]|nr:hypothetical protein [Pirellulales bacterium]